MVRRLIADVLGNLDGLIALEEKKHPNAQDTIGVAERLLEAGRAREALGWVRREKTGGLKYLAAADLADGIGPRDALLRRRTHLEAKILEALGEKDAAQSLRWAAFDNSLDADTLREYIAALPDFEDFAALDRAFAHALASPRIHGALAFLVEWPRLDLAAKLVIARHAEWDGDQYYILPPVAEALEYDHPLGAVILYRVLLNDILARARSKAYPHAARYLAKLYALAALKDAETERPADVVSHAHYRASLRKAHGRKSGLWALVGQG